MPRRVLVLGSGKRVQEAALPALRRLGEDFELGGVYARTEKTLVIEGEEVHVLPIERLELATDDLVFMAVAKKAVPSVLARLGGLGASGVDLLIDTPVLLFKHLGHLGRLQGFRNVWVSEDCTTLPCFDAVTRSIAAGDVGALRRIVFDRSAYAYHGLAMAKTVRGGGVIVRARRKASSGGRERRVTFREGPELVVVEPRDYRVGRMRFVGTSGEISEDPGPLRLEAIVEDRACAGFRVGEHETRLDDLERSLIGESLADAPEPRGVTAWMEGMKRVGFLRLLRNIEGGHGAYPLAEAIDDTVVDYHLEKIGFYVANPLTHPRHALARVLLKGLTRVAGG